MKAYTLINDVQYYIGVISHKRPQNVQAMQKICGPVTWYVGKGEGPAYAAAGAYRVVESGGLCESRNAILDDAFKDDLVAIELSDDLKKLELATDAKTKHVIDFAQAVQAMQEAMDDTGAMLCGVAPTSNAFFFNPKKPVHTSAFVVGDLIMVRPTHLRFDEDLRLKEDYDYTLQHLVTYGLIARANRVLASFQHRTNAGGACDYRTSQLEQQTIAQLKAKWPGLIKDNTRRKDEILLALRPTR